MATYLFSRLAVTQAPIRQAAHDFRQVLRITAVSWMMAVLVLLLVSWPAQSLEGMRMIAENAVDDHATSFDHAVPLGLIIAAIAASGMTWYWARVALYVLAPEAPAGSAVTRWSARNLPRFAGIVPMVSLAIAFWRAAQLKVGPRQAGFELLRLLAALGAVLALVMYGLFIVRRAYLQRRARTTGRGTVPTERAKANSGRLALRHLPRSTKAVLAGALALWLVALVGMIVTTGQVARNFGTASVVLLACATWTGVATTVMYLGAAARLPLLRLVIASALLFAVFNLTDNRTVRRQPRTTPALLPSARSTFTQWLEQRPDKALYDSGAYPVFFVAAEGGGLRAAYYTALVLSALQDRCPSFAAHTFAISGASGGSVGASVFAAGVAEQTSGTVDTGTSWRCIALPDSLPLNGRHYEALTDSVLGRDLLTPVFAAGLYQDLLQRFWPHPIDALDRARALERGLEESWDAQPRHQRFSRPFPELWGDLAHGQVPLLFVNTARVETGERMVIAPVADTDANGLGRVVTLADVNNTIDLRLSTAVFLGARFPYVTPEGEVPVRQRRVAAGTRYRYVDGGYFDDSGVLTLMDLMTSLGVLQRPMARPIRPIILRIGFSDSAKVDTGVTGLKFSGTWGAELLSPVRALLNVRVAHGLEAIQRLRAVNAQRPANGDSIVVLDVVLHQDSVPLVLGWQLSRVTRRELRNQVPAPARCEHSDSSVEKSNRCELGLAVELLSRSQRLRSR